MSAFLSIVLPIISALGSGGLALLLVTRIPKAKHYSSSMAGLGRLMAIGVPLLFVLNFVLSLYSPSRLFTYVCLFIFIILVFIIAYFYARRMREERRADRDEQG
jgi:hydrogenase-4 membrane subunit HyfE